MQCSAEGTSKINCTVRNDGSDGGLGATYEISGAGRSQAVKPGQTVEWSVDPGSKYDFTLTATQNGTGDTARSSASATTDKPVPTIDDYPNPIYRFSSSTNSSQCHTQECKGATAPRVLVTLSGYMPNEELTCQTHNGTYRSPVMRADGNGGGRFELQMYGYASDGQGLDYAVSSDPAASYNIWTCNRGTPAG